jgi:phosphatidate cytidylyltransferase
VKPLETAPRSGKAEAVPPKSEMLTRLFSALVLAAIALTAVVVSPWTFAALVIVCGIAVAWEWGRLVRGREFDAIFVLQATAVAAIAIFVTLARLDLAFAAVAIAFAGTLAIGIASGHVGWSLAGLVYSVLPAWSMVWLRSDAELGATALLFLFVVAWTTDTFSYAGGRLFGGPKLAPRVSPRKTWSGLILGTLTPALIGYAFAVLLQETSALKLALVSVAVAAACQVGDLSESAVKRRFGAKDMSGLIPGHGGLLDRIDGLLIAAIAAALIAFLHDPANPGRGLLIW